jgi:hypothetical protein
MEHEIKKDGFYSVLEILDYRLVNASERTLQNYAKKYNIRKIDNFYRFTGHQVIILRNTYEKRAKNKAKKIEMAERNERLLVEKMASIKDVDLNFQIDATDDETITEIFTIEEHEQLQSLVYGEPSKIKYVEKLIDTIEDYRNQITYLGKSLEKKDEQMTLLIHSIKDSLETIKETQKNMQQRNFIEAKEKGLDKE